MSITIIKGPEGVRVVSQAYGSITQLRSLIVAVSGEGNYVEEARSGYTARAAGAAAESASSGDIVRMITHGLVSGLICASGVQMGDSLQVESASGLQSGTGYVAPLVSGVGAFFGRAMISGGRGSGITVLVDLG